MDFQGLVKLTPKPALPGANPQGLLSVSWWEDPGGEPASKAGSTVSRLLCPIHTRKKLEVAKAQFVCAADPYLFIGSCGVLCELLVRDLLFSVSFILMDQFLRLKLLAPI